MNQGFSDKEDWELLQLMQHGLEKEAQELATALLLDKYDKLIYCIAKGFDQALMGQAKLPEDLVAEVWTKILSGNLHPGPCSNDGFKRWLLTICRNDGISAYRKLEAKRKYEAQAVFVDQISQQDLRHIDRARFRQDLQPREAQIFDLWVIGITVPEMVEQLGRSRSDIYRCIQTIIQKYEKFDA
jgi:RNA polymerase sigma factor (sigma-70 family)